MTEYEIGLLLKNSGLLDVKINNEYVSFKDPSCILPVFDQFLSYAWYVIAIFTAIMLLAWGILYIRNGSLNINNVFHNAKTIILIFAILSVVKPAIDFMYGDNLFARQCKTQLVSLDKVKKLLESKKIRSNLSDQHFLYDSFSITDSGIPEQNK